MTRTRKPDSEEQPTAGGSYVRDPATGKLKREEFTDLAGETAPPADSEPPATTAGAAGNEQQEA